MTKRSDKRAETERRLVEAVGAVLSEAGVAGLGVNAVAAKAGVDKVLIYRYFQDLPGLLRAFGESAVFWPTLDEVLGPDREALQEPTVARVGAKVLAAYANALRRRPLTLQLLGWECGAQGNHGAHHELTDVLERARETFSERLFVVLAEAGLPITLRVVAAAALLSGGINYLAVRGQHTPVFAGVAIDTDAGWTQLMAALEGMLEGVLKD